MKCELCGQEMKTADGCIDNKIIEYADGTKLPAIPREDDGPERCHDCGAKAGHFHHADCDMEKCPRCGDQLLSCEYRGGFFVTDSGLKSL